MNTYKQAGVNINLGDECSRIAYNHAKTTFKSRSGLKGQAILDEGGFTGTIDMGDYLLVQNADGIGTKMMVADLMGKYDTLGADLTAMVADDAICVGAEVISLTNVIDTEKVNKKQIDALMRGLARVCKAQKILIPGGEIAELSDMVRGTSWSATAVGIVKKKKLITGKTIRPGDVVIGLQSPNFRSNGFTLIRHILKKAYGNKWHLKTFRGRKWGDIILEPSIIYHNAVLELIGRFGKKRKVNIKGIVHITGGGLPGNAPRVLPNEKTMGFLLDRLPAPPPAMKELKRLGHISDNEAYRVWNMGIGMILVVNKQDVKKALQLLQKQHMKTQVIGKVTRKPGVKIITSR